MLQQPPHGERRFDNPVRDWICNTPTKILAVDAGLREFLRLIEKLTFSEEPSHQPDQQFVEELAGLLQAIEKDQKG